MTELLYLFDLSVYIVLSTVQLCSGQTTTVWPSNSTQPGDTSECRLVQGGYNYLGVLTRTRDGYKCQRWDSNSPHRHHYKQDSWYPEGNVTLAENYCRNPDLNWGEGLWCFTTSSRRRWDHCDVPFCNCKQTDKGTEFRGTISTTRSGKQCQNWFSQSPHSHNYTNVNLFPDRTQQEVGNNCRNPDGSKDSPWCFTTDPDTVWEYCNVVFCAISTTPSSVEPSTMSSGQTTQSYTASPSVPTSPGSTTVTSATQVPTTTVQTTTPSTIATTTTMWPEYPTQPGDTSECRLTQGGYRYTGILRRTRRGYTCQRWDSNSPHRHHYKQDNLYTDGNITLAESYCRNPDLNWGEGLWCYTTVARVRWDHCDVPFCNCKQTDKGTEFRGTISTTRSGKQCQNWFSQSPHSHNYTNVNLFPDRTQQEVGNNCRNPDGSKDSLWCFTTDPDTVWEYCDVVSCVIPTTTSTSTSTTISTSSTTRATSSARPTTQRTSTISSTNWPTKNPKYTSTGKSTGNPEKPLKQQEGKSGAKVAAIVAPTVILVIGGVVAGFLVFYFRGRLCPGNKTLMEEEPEPPTGHFDNPLYGQVQKVTETDA